MLDVQDQPGLSGMDIDKVYLITGSLAKAISA
jgi:hypothetical protein